MKYRWGGGVEWLHKKITSLIITGARVHTPGSAPIRLWFWTTSLFIIFSVGFSFHVFIVKYQHLFHEWWHSPPRYPPPFMLAPPVCAAVKIFGFLVDSGSRQLLIWNNAGTGQQHQDWALFPFLLSSVCQLKSTETSWSSGRSSWGLTRPRPPPPKPRQARRNEDLQRLLLCFSLRWINCCFVMCFLSSFLFKSFHP